MEEFSQLGTGENLRTGTGFIYGGGGGGGRGRSSSSHKSTAIAPRHPHLPSSPSSSSSMYGRHCNNNTFSIMQQSSSSLPILPNPFQHIISTADTTATTTMGPSSAKTEGGSSRNPQQIQDIHYPFGIKRGLGLMSPLPAPPSSSEEAIKEKIISHPQYSSLLEAYMDCQKVGAPPEVVARLTAITRDFEVRHRTAGISRDSPATDPELDQFMEAYYDMLVKYREELTRPLQEAMDFLRRVESQLSLLTNGSARVFSPDDKCEGVGSSEEDQDGSGGETELPEIDPRAEDKELKHYLLKKYSGYLSSLKQELSKKKKKGKLPKEARQKLLNWWELHYKWPYPSETEKLALAESTGLDQKQINNWFINQRKRHWKPSEDMQFVVMDGFHPHNAAAAAAFYMDGHHHFVGDGSYRLGP